MRCILGKLHLHLPARTTVGGSCGAKASSLQEGCFIPPSSTPRVRRWWSSGAKAGKLPRSFWPPEASRVRVLEASFTPNISCAFCEAPVSAWASALRSACHVPFQKKEAWGAPPVSAEEKSPVPEVFWMMMCSSWSSRRAALEVRIATKRGSLGMSQTIGWLRGWGHKRLSQVYCLVCARGNCASWTGQKALRISEVFCGVLAGGGTKSECYVFFSRLIGCARAPVRTQNVFKTSDIKLEFVTAVHVRHAPQVHQLIVGLVVAVLLPSAAPCLQHIRHSPASFPSLNHKPGPLSGCV